MGVQDGIKTGVKAGLGGLGLDLEAKIGNLEVTMSTLDERVKGLQEYLRCPMFTPRLLEAVGTVPAGPLPVLLDLGEVSPGLMWSTEAVAIGHSDPLIGSAVGGSVSGASNGSVTNPGISAQIASVTSLPPGRYNVDMTVGFGSTAGAIFNNFQLVTATRVVGTFGPPLVAGSMVTYHLQNISLSSAETFFNLRAAAADTGIYYGSLVVTSTSGDVVGAIYIGRPQTPASNTLPVSSIGNCIVPHLALPTYATIGGRRGIVRGGAHLYVLLAGPGLVVGDQWYATAAVTECVDTPEALTWF